MAARLRDLDLFGDVDAEALARLSPFARDVVLAAGETLVRVGEEADEVFVILDGTLEIIGGAGREGDSVLAELQAGSVTGEIAALTGGPRSATLRARDRVHLYALPARPFAELVDGVPDLAERLAEVARRRLSQTQLAQHLHSLFPEMAAATVRDLTGGVEWVSLKAGELLFRQGDPADAAYVVVTGRMRVLTQDDEGVVEPLAEVGAGELVGEAALLDDGTRSAHVVAARQSLLARFSRQAFEDLALRSPGVMLPVARLILRRSRDAMDIYRRAVTGRTSIGLLPLEPTVDVAGLAGELRSRFQRMGKTAHLNRMEIDRRLGTAEGAQARPHTAAAMPLERLLGEIEADHDLVIYEGEAAVSPWTRRCVQQVDHLVLVANAADHRRITELERVFITERELPHQRVSLVLLHEPDVDRPTDTASWLAERDVDQHHHVRRSHESDLDRLARHLAGRAVCLVLSGGGAKGFGHLGVARAMAEHGLPIDAVAGSSMGSAMAALIASEAPPEEYVPKVAAIFHKVLDYTVPVAGLISGHRIEKAAVEFSDRRAVEDLWLPYFCVSTNLTTSRLVVHRTGDLGLALRSTLSIPGVMPPVPVGEDLLVDGGVMNNIPVDIMRRLYPTATIIASDVAPVLGPRARTDYGMHVSGARLMMKRLTPGVKAPKVPPLMATLMRSLLVSAAEARDRLIAQEVADLYLQLALPGVGLLEFDATERVEEAGYQEARALIEQWKA